MCNYAFNLSANQKVAQTRKTTIKFERAYKLFEAGPLIRINELKEGEDPLNGTMDIKLDNSFNIIVSFNKLNYSKLREMNSVDPKTLNSSLGFPVLYHALSTIKDSLLCGSDEFKQLDWANTLDLQFGIFENLESSDDVLRMTDQILESPLINLYDHCIKNHL
jgi:hypothetical protein